MGSPLGYVQDGLPVDLGRFAELPRRSACFERKTSYFTADGRPNGRCGLQVFLAEGRTQANEVSRPHFRGRFQMLPDAPHCPIHVAVLMIPIEPEIQRGHRYGKIAFLKKKISEELRSKPRWRCPVAGCNRCHVSEDSV
jgi:hypothetical protein